MGCNLKVMELETQPRKVNKSYIVSINQFVRIVQSGIKSYIVTFRNINCDIKIVLLSVLSTESDSGLWVITLIDLE